MPSKDNYQLSIMLLIGGVGIAAITHFLFGSMDPVESWVTFTRDHEELELDELPMIFFSLLIYALFILWSLHRANLNLIKSLRESVARRQTAENDMRKALAARDGFFAAMSHDLRTPVNGIVGFSEMIRSETFGPLGHEKYKEYADCIHRAGSLLNNTITQILDVSKIAGEGELPVHEEVFDPMSEIEFCRRLVGGWTGDKRIIEFTGNADGASILVDRSLFRRYVINLLANSIKYAGDGAAVGIHMMSNGENAGLTLTVYDDGTGVGVAQLHDAGKPFTRMRGVDDDSYMTSAGLGLWIVQNIAKVHQCEISIRSDAGQGFRVVLGIPAARVVARAEEQVPLAC